VNVLSRKEPKRRTDCASIKQHQIERRKWTDGPTALQFSLIGKKVQHLHECMRIGNRHPWPRHLSSHFLSLSVCVSVCVSSTLCDFVFVHESAEEKDFFFSFSHLAHYFTSRPCPSVSFCLIRFVRFLLSIVSSDEDTPVRFRLCERGEKRRGNKPARKKEIEGAKKKKER